MKSFKEFNQDINEAVSTDRVIFVEDITDAKRSSGYLRARISPSQIAAVQSVGDRKRSVYDRAIYELEKTAATAKYPKKVYRYDTPTIRGKFKPAIKIDLKKEMVYFADQESMDRDDEELKFETRGEKIQFLVVYDKKKFLAGQ